MRSEDRKWIGLVRDEVQRRVMITVLQTHEPSHSMAFPAQLNDGVFCSRNRPSASVDQTASGPTPPIDQCYQWLSFG
jgi:hypothetical protein